MAESYFKTEKLTLKPDNEGEVIATLVSSPKNQGNRKSVLYVHGFIDYCFNEELAENFSENNFDFYGLDLRKYGRSILPHQTPNYCENIEVYYEEIDQVIAKIKVNNSNELFLLGHSNGGLITSSYMNNGNKRNEISGLILNSPFFDLFEKPFVRNFLYNLAKIVVKIAPKTSITGVPPVYVKSLHKDYQGEWNFNLDWKPVKGFPTYFKWAIGIIEAQRKLHNSNIEVPILVMHSDKSTKTNRFSEKIRQSDIVLDVEDIKRIGSKLGKNVSMVEIKNGIHDLFLSEKSVRNEAKAKMFEWLNSLS